MERRKALEEIVGPENVIDDRETLLEYSRDISFAPKREPSYLVRPKTPGEVQAIVQWANRNNVPLIPVSSGPPRLRGDTVPTMGGVIVDMSLMSEIKMIDRPDRVAMVEPGVRFGRLQEALAAEGLRVPSPLCPRSTKSVLGSFLEREPHIMPKYHLDASEPLLCTETVFGTGDVFRTGEASGPGTIDEQWEMGRRQKDHMGFQTDIFRLIQGSQGTMGIVTWASLRCEVLPKIQKPFLVPADKIGGLLALAYRLVRLRLGDEVFLLNDHALASIVGESPDEIDRLRRALPRWILFYCVAGYAVFPQERVEYQERDISETAKAIGVTPTPEAVAGIGAEELLELAGRPSKEPYWKLRYRGGCQEIFFVSPFSGIPGFVDTVYESAAKSDYNQPLGVYVQPINQGHGYHCEFDLAYDPGDPSESEQVRQLYLSTARTLMSDGAFFSRPYDLLSEMVLNRDGVTRASLMKVKAIFDPNNVMNPGKLCF